MEKIKVFVFDSKNTGYYRWEGTSIILAMKYARNKKHSRIERGNDFWEYKNGEMISWNATMLA